MVNSFGDKRGQLSVAILLAGVIVVFAIFLWSIRPDIRVVPSVDTLPEAQAFVTDCLRLAVEENLVRTSLYGGFVFLEGARIETPIGIAGVFANGSTLLAPTVNQTAVDLDDAVAQSVTHCLETRPASPGMTIVSIGDITVRVLLGTTETQAELTGSIRATRDNKATTIDSASVQIPVRYAMLHDLAIASAQHIGESYGNVDLTYFDRLSVPSDISAHSKGVVTVTFFDSKSLISGRPYLYSFYVATPDEAEPVWSIASRLNVNSLGGEQFKILGDAAGFDISSDTPLLRIGANTATTTPSAPGNYNVTLTARSLSFTPFTRTIEVNVR